MPIGRMRLLLAGFLVYFFVSFAPVLLSLAARVESTCDCSTRRPFTSIDSSRRSATGLFGSDCLAQTIPIRKRYDDYSLRLDRARQLMRDGAYDDAARILESLVAEKPEILTAAEMLSTCYMRAGRAREAIDLIEKRLERSPGNFSLIKNLGLAYLELGDRRRAVESWRRLLSSGEKKG